MDGSQQGIDVGALPVAWKVVGVLANVLLGVGVSISTINYARMENVIDSVNDIKREIAVIRGSIFTSVDGAKVWQEMARMRANHALHISANHPPLKHVERHRNEQSRINALSNRVGRIEFLLEREGHSTIRQQRE